MPVPSSDFPYFDPETGIEIARSLLPAREKVDDLFALEVHGDSMIDAHIEKGDMVIVEKNNQAQDMQIVIAEVDGEFTMKYFRKQGSRVWLQPANKNYKPIYPVHSFNIIAVLKAVIRKY